eukprot:6671494-Prymnesium_polylepis.1
MWPVVVCAASPASCNAPSLIWHLPNVAGARVVGAARGGDARSGHAALPARSTPLRVRPGAACPTHPNM